MAATEEKKPKRSPQSRKRIRQNTKIRLHNMDKRSAMRSAIKSFLKSLEAYSDKPQDKENSILQYRKTVSLIDRAASKGIHPKKRASRLKSRLNERLKKLAT